MTLVPCKHIKIYIYCAKYYFKIIDISITINCEYLHKPLSKQLFQCEYRYNVACCCIVINQNFDRKYYNSEYFWVQLMYTGKII